MKRTLLTMALLSILGAAGSQAADRRNFWLLNNTGKKINQFYIAAHGTGETWGQDVLGQSALPDSLGTVIFFRDQSNRCVYDFRVVYTDGSYQEYTAGRNLCDVYAVQFNRETNQELLAPR